jgi:YidC/Oxa1 family membrane protein insertase
MALYRENKLNPFSSLIMLFIQLPIIIALYQVFWRELSNSTFDNHLFLGLINLGERSLVMAFLAAVFQYFQGKLSLLPPQKTDSSANANLPAASVGKTMVFVGPLLTVLVLSALPSALGLYWITSTVFSIAQQVYINKKLKNHLNNHAENRGKT